MQDLLKILLQHIDTIIQAFSTIITAFIPGRQKNPRIGKKKSRKQHKEEQAKRGKVEHLLKHYIHTVLSDPNITQIQILGMNHPLKLEEVYVPLRVHPGSTLQYALDPKLREAEETHDPHLLLQAAQTSLEHFIDSAIDPDEAIRSYKRCVLVGNPGAGKTTLLRYLTIKSAKNELVSLPSFPVYVQLNAFNSEEHKDLLGFIMSHVDTHIHQADTPVVHELLFEKMKAGHMLLLLDGLDETRIGIGDEDAERYYVAMVNAIRKLAAVYPLLPIVVSVRKAGYEYRPKLQGFDELEVVDFRAEDSKLFVTKWFNASQATSKEEKIKDLNARLERSLRMQMLASNPLILSLIAILYEGNLELPERRADFYKQFVEVLQSKWDASRDIKHRREFPLVFQTHLLQEIAWHFHNQGMRNFPAAELLQVISKFLLTLDIPEDQGKHVLEQIVINNGLLREQAHGWYGFSHLTFQEYFVTQYIIANNQQEDLLKNLNNPWWEEVLLLFMGSIHDASSLLNILMGHDKNIPLQDDMFYSHLILAGRCLAERPRVQYVPLREEIISKLFEVLQSTPYSLTREQVANTLIMIRGSRVNNHLLRLLSSTEDKLRDIRESIGRAMGISGERGIAQELAVLLSNKHAERYIRILVARALGVLSDQSVAHTLLRFLSDDQEDIYVRQSIALTLGALGGQNVIPSLSQLLDSKDRNPLVQQSVVVALGMLGNQSPSVQLQELLADDGFDWHVRGSAAKALSILDTRRAVPTMLRILEDDGDDLYVRERVAIVMGNFSPEIVPLDQLLTLLTDETLAPSVRSCIARAIGPIGEQKVKSLLLQLLVDERTNHSVRISIATALGYLGDRNEQVIHALHEIRSDRQIDSNLRGSVTAALGMLGMRVVIYELLELIENVNLNQDILLHIIHALANLGEDKSEDKQLIAVKLVELLSSKLVDRYKGQNIVKLLCTLGERSIIPALLELLPNSSLDRDIRQHVAHAVAQTAHDEASLACLHELLHVTDIDDDIFCALWAVNRHVKSKGFT